MRFHTGLELDGAMHEPVNYLRGIAATGTSGGVSRKGFFAHPPPNGKTTLAFLMRLPAQRASLRGFAGIRDGAVGKSNGVRFSVEVNGKEVWNRTVNAGEGWTPFVVSLAQWAGQTVLLRLVTDSLGDYGWDWAQWGEVRVE